MTEEGRHSPLARVIFLRSFIPGMLILLAFTLLAGNIILSAVQASFEDRLRSSQKLFVDTISSDLLMGANAAVYARCQLYKTTQPVDSIELLDLNGRPLCGAEAGAPRGGMLIESPIFFDESGREKASTLRVRYSTSLLGAAKLKYGLLLAAAIFVLGVIHFVVARAISVTVSAPIADISRLLASGDVGAILRSDEPRSAIQEVGALRASMKVLASRIVEYQKELVAGAQREATAQMAAQVAHDIRSPLAALDSALKDIAQIPEEKRALLRAASGRIRGIAEGLLDKNRESRAGGAPASALEPLIDSVVEEKRLLIPETVKLDAAENHGADGVFAAIDPGAFKRVLSNLLNNAIESLDGGGTIGVALRADASQVRVTVNDDGKGIPPEVLSRLGERGVSWGKKGGSGLGLSHAKAFAENHGGRLEIASEVEKGTTAALILPRIPAPAWFVSDISVEEGGGVVVLDDDPGIHAVWKNRFGGVNAVLRHFSEPDELRGWVKAHPEAARESLCLFDYELAQPAITGLALARELGLLAKMILVTGRAEDAAVISECAAAGVRLLPKSRAARVPLRSVAPASAPDCVLVDDDELVRKVWALAAKRAGKRLTAFRTTAECLEAAARLDRGTEIYLDSQLGPEERGEDLALELHARGFSRIYMATGRDPGALQSLPWLAGVVGKEPPWS